MDARSLQAIMRLLCWIQSQRSFYLWNPAGTLPARMPLGDLHRVAPMKMSCHSCGSLPASWYCCSEHISLSLLTSLRQEKQTGFKALYERYVPFEAGVHLGLGRVWVFSGWEVALSGQSTCFPWGLKPECQTSFCRGSEGRSIRQICQCMQCKTVTCTSCQLNWLKTMSSQS